MGSVTSSFHDPSGFIFRYENNIYRQVNRVFAEDFDRFIEWWFYPEMTDTSLRVDHPYLEVKNEKKATCLFLELLSKVVFGMMNQAVT